MSSKELVISSNRHETRLAMLEDDQLVEVFFQRSNEYSLAGSVHKGRVTRVLPGMQSAFVDLGLERDTFLYVSDFYDDHSEDIDSVTGGAEERPAVRREDHGNREAASPGGGGVSILINRGDGTFEAAIDYAGGGTSLIVADLDGDGKPDFATAL